MCSNVLALINSNNFLNVLWIFIRISFNKGY
jgi:hypothetical protein